MTSRSYFAGTAVSSTVFSAADANDYGGGAFAKGSATSNQTGITTAVDLTGLTSGSVTVNSSRILKISWNVDIQSSVAGDNCAISVLKDGSLLDAYVYGVSTVDNIGHASGFTLDEPTAASHEYKLQLGRTGSSSGTWNTRASATTRAWILVEDVGPSF